MKTIQITIQDDLLSALDRALKGETRRRSAFIRQSIALSLQQMKIRQLEMRDRKGYEAHPVQPGEFDNGAGQLPWGDPWQPRKRKRARR